MQSNSDIELRFLGGAETVTGSKYLLTFGSRKILVDCGLFQGLKELRLKNWDRFPIDPSTIDHIILTHAHIDHSGYIPRLIKEGFRGKIHSTTATLELCKILLPDTGYLQEEEAAYLNHKKASKHKPALPLFNREEAERSLSFFETHEFDQPFRLGHELKVNFSYAGHILGAGTVRIEWADRSIAFSGDLGRQDDLIFFPPRPLSSVDYLVVESTYGDKSHIDVDPLTELEGVINEACRRGGPILIPAFAVGRAQSLMYLLTRLRVEGRIPEIPMFLNSPMAIHVSEIFQRFQVLHKLSRQQCEEMTKQFTNVHTVEESKALNDRKGPMIIVSASGMMTGGRILHHVKAFGPDPKTTIVLAGYQADGTRGRALQNGKDEIRIHGQPISIRAQIRTLENLSAHADASETIKWLNLRSDKFAFKRVFITHGEKPAAESLREKLKRELNCDVIVPKQDQEFTL